MMWKLSKEMIEIVWQSKYDTEKNLKNNRIILTALGLVILHVLSIPYEIMDQPWASKHILIAYGISYSVVLCFSLVLYAYLEKTRKAKNASRIYFRLWLKSTFYGVIILYMAILFLRSSIVTIQYWELFLTIQSKVYLWMIIIWLFTILFTVLFAKKITPPYVYY